MRLIVLAAGSGTRMGQLTDGLPKPLVVLPDGTTLLERNIRAMESVAPIEEMLLVSGHAAEEIDAAALRLRVLKPIRVQYNPFYHTSGPIVSVWLARTEMTDKDFLLCNGDTVYGTDALASLAEGEPGRIVLGVDRHTRRSDDDMKVQLDSNGNLLRVAKDIPDGSAQGVSTGLVAVRGPELRRAFVKEACHMIRDRESLRPSVAWHGILNALVRKGVSIATKELDGSDWHEVDTIEDLNSVSFPPVRPGLQSVSRESAHAPERQRVGSSGGTEPEVASVSSAHESGSLSRTRPERERTLSSTKRLIHRLLRRWFKVDIVKVQSPGPADTRRAMLRLAGRMLVALSPLIPRKRSLILFGDRCDDCYMDNSQHLFEWMLAHRKDIDAVWVARTSNVIELLRRSGRAVVSSRSLRGLWLLSRAGACVITGDLEDIAVDEAAIPASLKVICLTHGKSVKGTGLAFRDPEVAAWYRRSMSKLRAVTMCGIATSPFLAELHSASRGVRMVVTGYPRNDVLLTPTEEAKALWKDFLGTSRFNKVVLYAPSWRHLREPTRFFPFPDFDRASLFDFLQSRRILLLLRPHNEDLRRYHEVRDLVSDLAADCASVRSASSDILPDVSTFLPFVDMLISDYSSLYHDFLLLDRPLMFIPYDYEEFSRQNGFMYDYFALLPGPRVSSLHDFCSHLDSLCRGEDPFRDKRRALRDKIHTYQDSNSCERVAALVDRVLQNKVLDEAEDATRV